MIIGNEGPLSQQQHEAIELFETAIQWGMCTAQPTVATWCQTFERFMPFVYTGAGVMI